MKHEIQTAYDRAAPDRTTAVQIFDRVMREAETVQPVRRVVPRRLVLIAAVVAAVALLSTLGYAAYQRWFLPAPETYDLGNNGVYDEHERKDYTLSGTDSPSQTDGAPEETDLGPLSDEALIQKGLEILNQVGMLDVHPEQLTVVRQENLYWAREEAEIRFDQGDIRTSVKFDATTGRFLGMSGIDWQISSNAACDSDEDAEAFATKYYEALPVEQGYQLTHVEQYDEQYWSYDFCREVEPGVYNQYEMVRIAINPVSGRLISCTVFYVPLLDDHEPGQERLTQEEAEQVVQNSLPELLDGKNLIQAEVVIGLPNWNFTEYQAGPNHRASNVTRWAWQLTYERPNSEFADVVTLLVDCYTGEILGGDSTG